MAETTWEWVQGDNKDPAERWKLMDGDRVVLECGQVDAEYQDAILAGRMALAACRDVARMLEDQDMPREIPETIDAWDRAYEDITEALAAARLEVPRE